MAVPQLPNWQQVFLKSVGAPVTPANLKFIDAWARAEGGSASNNPFNTTQTAPGASSYNSVGVRNYLTPQQGLQATARTLQNGRYGNILSALKTGTDPLAAAQALANSPWGTGALVQKILGGGGGAAPSPAPAPPGVTTQTQAPSLDLFNAGNQMFGLPQLHAPLPAPLALKPSSVPAVQYVAGAQGKISGVHAVKVATQALGVPYVWGGESVKGFDCSGLLQYAWKQSGVDIPRTTYDQWKAGQNVDPNHLAVGDAVFFKGSDSITRNGEVLPGHVGIYIGGGKYIEAPHTGAVVRISKLNNAKGFMGARRYS